MLCERNPSKGRTALDQQTWLDFFSFIFKNKKVFLAPFPPRCQKDEGKNFDISRILCGVMPSRRDWGGTEDKEETGQSLVCHHHHLHQHRLHLRHLLEGLSGGSDCGLWLQKEKILSLPWQCAHKWWRHRPAFSDKIFVWGWYLYRWGELFHFLSIL